MEKYFGDIFGNSNIVNFFISAKENNTLAHAYIIEGDKGSGKTELAKCICTMLANGDSVLKKRISEQSCPDVTFHGLPDKKKFIPVETVRSIKAQAYIKPSELDIRAFIIKDAHMLTAAGQNAILKLLEEPPHGVYFFLLCQNASALLPTVRSRAPTVRMQRFSAAELEDYIRKNNIIAAGADTAQLSVLCQKAAGSIGNLLFLIENNSKSKAFEHVENILTNLKNNDFPGLLCAVSSLPQDRKQFEAVISDLAVKIRDLIAVSCNSTLYMSSNSDECNSLRGDMTIKNLIAVYRCVESTLDAINMNMNVQILKISLAKQMMRARTK